MILVCAATRTEAGACAAAEVEVLRTGVGPARAAAALESRLASGPPPGLVVSSGFAGALTGGLALHGCVTAGALFRLEQGRAEPVPLAPGRLRAAPGAAPCALLSADRVTGTAAARLPAPAAVDMESAALAEVAARHGLAFAVLRVITDTPSAPFPRFVDELAAALAAGPGRAGLAAAARAAGGAVRTPGAALRFVRSSLAARRELARAWRGGGAGLVNTDTRSPRTP